MRYFIILLIAGGSLGNAQDLFSGIGPFEVKKVISFEAATADANGSGVFRVKTTDGFLKTLSCTLPSGAKPPIKRVKILERDTSQMGKNLYFCQAIPE